MEEENKVVAPEVPAEAVEDAGLDIGGDDEPNGGKEIGLDGEDLV